MAERRVRPVPAETPFELVHLLHTAIFGRWDAEENKHIPGALDRITSIERNQRIFGIVGGAIGAVLLARALGVPTELVAKLLAMLF